MNTVFKYMRRILVLPLALSFAASHAVPEAQKPQPLFDLSPVVVPLTAVVMVGLVMLFASHYKKARKSFKRANERAPEEEEKPQLFNRASRRVVDFLYGCRLPEIRPFGVNVPADPFADTRERQERARRAAEAKARKEARKARDARHAAAPAAPAA